MDESEVKILIGKVLQEVLGEKNINVSQLSRMINVSNQTLYSIIKRDNMKIDFDVLLKICKALNVDIERFYADYIETHRISITSLSNYESRIVKMLDKLNANGQHKAETYIKDLLGNPSYIKDEVQKHEYTLADYGQIAAEDGEGSRGPNVEEFDIL